MNLYSISDKIVFKILQEINNVLLNSNKIHIFKPEIALRTTLGGGWRSGGISFENDISFYVPRDIQISDVDMFIKDNDGNIIINLKEDTEYLYNVNYDTNTLYSGFHTMYWDLAHKAPRIQDDFISMYYSARGGYGPDALPGEYTIEIITPDQKVITKLNVEIDPRWDIPMEDLENQFNTANEVIEMINESQEKLKEMRSIISQIKNFIELTKGNDFHNEIKSLGNNIISKLSNIAKLSLAKLKDPNSKASLISFSNLLL